MSVKRYRIAIGVTWCLIFLLLGFVVYETVRENAEESAGPIERVTEFLNLYLKSSDTAEHDKLISEYWEECDPESVDISLMEAVSNKDCFGTSAILEYANGGYLEYSLRDSKGNQMNPRLLLVVKLGDTGKIGAAKFGRLEPFSKYDKEWEEYWYSSDYTF